MLIIIPDVIAKLIPINTSFINSFKNKKHNKAPNISDIPAKKTTKKVLILLLLE